MTGREKWLWAMVLFAFALIEIRAINHDRNEHDAQQAQARQRERESFEGIAGRINRAIQQSDEHFQATMRSTDALVRSTTTTVHTSQQTLDRMTGAGSYLVVTPIPLSY